jgi:hypothetical protein
MERRHINTYIIIIIIIIPVSDSLKKTASKINYLKFYADWFEALAAVVYIERNRNSYVFRFVIIKETTSKMFKIL